MQRYLCTTGISEFWDINSETLFLGPWCLIDQKNKDLVKDKNYIVIPSPWKPAFKIKEAADYCYALYEDLLPRLSEHLNSIHQVSYPNKYWQILVGPWLLFFINIFFDRYRRIENAVRLFPDLYTFVLPKEKCKLNYLSTYDFLTSMINDDYYNLKLFTIIAHDLLPQNTIENNIEFISEKQTDNIYRYGWKRRFYYWLLKQSSLFTKNNLILCDMYHLDRWDSILLQWKAKANSIQFLNLADSDRFEFKHNHDLNMRTNWKLKTSPDRFLSLLYRVIPDVMPLAYLENYNFFKNSINCKYSIKIIGSAIGWYFNERFKFFAAELASKGGKLIDFQHGGGYGFLLSVLNEKISLEKDVFYTWGWRSKDNHKTRILPSPHLSKLRDTYTPRHNKILFISSTIPRYDSIFTTINFPEDMGKYINDKKLFFQYINKEIVKNISYRPFPKEFGWRDSELIKKLYPDLQLKSDGKLTKLMQNAKLIVIDHAHTSFFRSFNY